MNYEGFLGGIDLHGKPLLKVYLLFLFCTLSLILSLLTMLKHEDMLFLRGECVTCMVFLGI